MYRAVLTLLVGLMLSLGVGASASNVLPNASPEEQYSFALGRAMQNDLKTAASAFAEFIEINNSHARAADALFWLGRVHYLREDYENAAMTFSEFSARFPEDERLGFTTLLIAQSVSHFAPAAQACAIYDALPGLLFSPTEKFTAKLAAISEAKNCGLAPFLTGAIQNLAEKTICNIAITEKGIWETESVYWKYVTEAKRRNLTCESAMPLSQIAKHKYSKPSSSTGQTNEIQQKAEAETQISMPTATRVDNRQTANNTGGYSLADFLEKNAVNSELENTLLLMMERRDDEACRTVMYNVGRTFSPIWHKLRVLCAAAQGDGAGTQFSLDVLQASGEQDPIFYGLMSLLLSGSKYKVPSSFSGMSKEQTLLYLTVMDAAHVDIDVGHLENLENRHLNVLLGLRYLTPEAREYTTCGNFADITDPELKYLEIGAEKARMLERSVKKGAFDCHAALSGFLDTVSTPNQVLNSATNAEQIAKEERLKRLELENELAALRAQQEQRQQTITNDNQIPLIDVASQQKDEATALVYGRATDNVGLGDVQVNNELVQIGSDGSFQTQLYIPPNGLVVEITAYDLKGNKATKTLSLARKRAEGTAETSFTQLQPSLGKRGAINRNAIALIVGVEKYENLPARPAIHADKDAEYFADFAHYKLGVPRNNIIKAINSNARRLDILKALAKVTQLSKENESEVFIFFAGHALASDDGKDVFLIPYDGDTGSFLADTAITRGEIFEKVERIEPKFVTVFLDACYTGGTRSEGTTLVPDKRPIRIEALNQSVPQGFTILSASASDETSKALEAAEHGMFSYFLMKGMEGDADADNDNQITMAEMRDYVKDKVVRQSNFQQTPELQGDADRVLVRFQ